MATGDTLFFYKIRDSFTNVLYIFARIRYYYISINHLTKFHCCLRRYK